MKLPDLNRPPLPPRVEPGGHGGSHGYLMNEFVTAILQDRKPLVDIVACAEHDSRRDRRASVGPEGRRADEDSAVFARLNSQISGSIDDRWPPIS